MPLDDLPLFADDKQLAEAILGKRAKDWPLFVKYYEGRGLPGLNSFFGCRYVPAVKQFFDALYGVGSGHIPAPEEEEHPYERKDARIKIQES